MLSLILYGALAVVVAAVVVSVLVVVLPDDTVSVAERDRVPAGLPTSGDVDAHDVDRVRLPVVVRGYRMVDTDAVLDRLSAEIDRRDQEIAALRASSVAPEASSVVAGERPDALSPAESPAESLAESLAGSRAGSLADPAAINALPVDPPPGHLPPVDLSPANQHPVGEQPWSPPPSPPA